MDAATFFPSGLNDAWMIPFSSLISFTHFQSELLQTRITLTPPADTNYLPSRLKLTDKTLLCSHFNVLYFLNCRPRSLPGHSHTRISLSWLLLTIYFPSGLHSTDLIEPASLNSPLITLMDVLVSKSQIRISYSELPDTIFEPSELNATEFIYKLWSFNKLFLKIWLLITDVYNIVIFNQILLIFIVFFIVEVCLI